MKIRSFLFSMVFFGLILPQTRAQRINPDAIQAQYPNDDAVILHQKEHLFIEQDAASGDLKVWLKSEEETLILNASNIAFSNDAIFYTSFSDIKNVKAETLIPISRNKYRTVPVTDIEEQNVLESGIFYSDYKRKKII